jgi:hypothetical protein
MAQPTLGERCRKQIRGAVVNIGDSVEVSRCALSLQ